jgi:hypothetical protein
MEITRNSLETAAGPGDWFTGDVYIDTVATAAEPSRLGRGARAFHSRCADRLAHPPLGQTIYVTEGIGR